MAHSHGHLHHRKGPNSVQEHTFHVQKKSVYLRTLIQLLFLMIATVVFAEFHFADLHLGPLTVPGTMINNVVAMLIAVTKASLVLAFFMGVIYSTKLTKLWAAAGFIGFSLLFLALGDYSTRRYEPTPRWNADPGSSLQRSIPEARKGNVYQQFQDKTRF